MNVNKKKKPIFLNEKCSNEANWMTSTKNTRWEYLK